MAGARGRNRSLVVAIAASAVVHLFVLMGPSWRLPTEDASVLPPLDARLTPLPKPGLRQPDEKRVVLGDAPPPRPRPRPRKPVRPAEPQVASGPVVEAMPAPDPALVASQGDSELDTKETKETAAPVEQAASADPATDNGTQKASGPGLADLWAASGKIQYNVIRGGVCGQCMTRHVGGDIEHRDSFLSPAEQADFLMPCVSRGGPCVSLDL